MRPWLLMFLLLLSILIHEAHGIRLGKGFVPDGQQRINIHQKVAPGKMRNNNIDGVEEVIVCTRKHCSGRIRKLTMAPISSTTTIAKNNEIIQENISQPEMEGSSANKKIARKEENLSVNSSSKTHPDRDSDVLDVAGMDYSLARRKPPIHN